VSTNEFPIDRVLVHKMAYLPVKLAELSYKNTEVAMGLLRDWGQGKKPVSQLWKEIEDALEENVDGK
jgi:hypothetical protein